jgi:hypothetical protein
MSNGASPVGVGVLQLNIPPGQGQSRGSSTRAGVKLLYLALRNIKRRWGAAPAWKAALPHFPLLFPDRFEPEP